MNLINTDSTHFLTSTQSSRITTGRTELSNLDMGGPSLTLFIATCHGRRVIPIGFRV